SHAPQEAATGHLVELGDALGEHQRAVVGQAGDSGAELDRPGGPQGARDEEVGARDVLPHRREVLADPRLLEVEPVEDHELLQVLVEGAGGVGAGRVERHVEVADAHGASSRASLASARTGRDPVRAGRQSSRMKVSSIVTRYSVIFPFSMWAFCSTT